MSQGILFTGGPYRQATNNSPAITSTSTNIDGGVAKNVIDGENLHRSSWKTGNQTTATVQPNSNIVSIDATLLTTSGTYTVDVGASLYRLKLSATSHGLSVGDMVYSSNSLYYPGLYKVERVASANSAVFSSNYDGIVVSETGLTIYKVVGEIANQLPENFIMKKNDATLNGQVKDKLSAGAADYGRNSVNKVNAVRTNKVATAIRAGNFSFYSGTFSSSPSNANDYASMDIDGSNEPDDESKTIRSGYGVGGEIIFSQQRVPTTGQYDGKTT